MDLGLLRLCILVTLSLACRLGIAQDKRVASRVEVDKTLNDVVRQFNAKMAGTKVDEITVVKFMAYDESVPMLSYLYGSSYFANTGKRALSSEHAQAVKHFNIEKTCSSEFKQLMGSYGLQVVHSFSDSTTGRNLLDVRVTFRDCQKLR